MSQLLKNKTILVTGASQGIGRAAAKRFAEEGATVILLARDEDNLNSIYDEIEAAGLPQPAVVPFDLNNHDEAAYIELARVIDETFGQLDGLLHNASLLGKRTPITNYDIDTWLRLMQVNVTAEFLLTKHLMPALEKAEHASVIFTSSSVGRTSKAFWGAYAVSKFATEGLMQTLAIENANITNVRFNSLNPGGTRTAMRAEAYPAENPTQVPAASEIMQPYVHLMSDESIGTNGQALDAQ